MVGSAGFFVKPSASTHRKPLFVLSTFRRPSGHSDFWHWLMRPQLARALEELGWVDRDDDGAVSIAEEIARPDEFYEGSSRPVWVNAYERNRAARDKCVQHYGPSCSVCKIDFGKVYGPMGEGFIHVHHLKPLSEIDGTYRVDPVRDLRPVCPNCHAMLHHEDPPLSIEELRSRMELARRY